MILTHGNIRKSRILKYIFLDLPDDALLSAYEENSAQYMIFDGLHDSKIRITKIDSDIVIDFSKNRHGGADGLVDCDYELMLIILEGGEMCSKLQEYSEIRSDMPNRMYKFDIKGKKYRNFGFLLVINKGCIYL